MFVKDRGDSILAFAAFFQVVVLMFQELLISFEAVAHESFRNISIMISAMPMVISVYYIINRRFLLFLITYGLIFFIILVTIIFFPDNSPYLIPGVFYLLFVSTPSFLCLASIRDSAVLERTILYLSYIIFALGVVYFFFVWTGHIAFLKYSMSFSNYLLLPALVFINQRNTIFSFLFVITCIMMLMLGSRGALVAAAAFAISLWMIDGKSKSLIIIPIIIIILWSGNVLLNLSDSMSITSRTLTLILQGDFIISQSRIELYSKTWESITGHPFWGYGLYGDRLILDGLYCHNIFLEVLHNFGLLFGAGLIILLSSVAIRLYIKSDIGSKKLLLLLFYYGFFPLLVSGSYLNDPEFGIFIGSLFSLSGYNSSSAFQS